MNYNGLLLFNEDLLKRMKNHVSDQFKEEPNRI